MLQGIEHATSLLTYYYLYCPNVGRFLDSFILYLYKESYSYSAVKASCMNNLQKKKFLELTLLYGSWHAESQAVTIIKLLL